MRNTLEYPVTTEETKEILDKLRIEKMALMQFGDMRPLVLRLVCEFLEYEEIAERFDKYCKERF